MKSVADGIELLNVAAFLLLAATGLARLRRGSVADRWLTAAFGALGGVLLASLFLPENPPSWVEKVDIVVLLLFPYFLYRFTSSFRPGRRRIDVAATVAVAAVVAVSLALPHIPQNGTARPGWVSLYIGLILLYWTALSGIVVVQLWRAGGGHPTLTRRRMRLMSVAAAGLNVGILFAGASPPDSVVVDAVLQAVVLFTAVAFLLGFSPPRSLRLAWRSPEQQAAREAMDELLRAESATDVTNVLLPHVAAIIGASGAALVDADGRVVASHDATPDMLAELEEGSDNVSLQHPELIPIGNDHGSLVAWTTPYTPFFGRDDLLLVQDLGAVGALALARAELLERERGSATAAGLAQAAAERANLAKNEFLSSMSHELRTPLNAILGFGQLLQAADLTERDKDSVEHVMKAGRHLLELVNEVLDLSRIEAGRLTLSPEPVRVDELVHESVDLMQPAAESRGISLRADLVTCDVHIQADRQRLKQVLLNLLSNAVKYNRDGGKVDVTCAETDGERIRIRVRDTGPGISANRMPALFEAFERLGAERTTVEGTGLGLALARRLMEAMGGAMGVDSIEGEGSTFWLELAMTESPVAAFERGNGQSEASGTVARDGGSQARGLLLIEDNLSNLKLVERILEARPGVSVLSAMQGGLGLELAHQHLPDLILLDLHLPDIPGDQVLHRLRADPATRSIPVIVVSADATPGQIRRLLEAGASDYLTKPIDVRRLLEVVDATLIRDRA
jgi:signal transduction histidine kinase/CheY-like chemotaxis protein